LTRGAGLDVAVEVKRGAFVLHAEFAADAPVTAIYGGSGAGKTSLLDVIAGLLRPVRGHLTLGGEHLFDGQRQLFVAPHRRRIGYVFQDDRLFPHLDVEANLRYGSTQGEGPHLSAVVEMLEIGALLRRRPRELSGGERRRVALGRALLCGPRLLLLDEPLNGVERGLKTQILRYLARVHAQLQIPMLYVSHALDELLQLTHVFVVIEDGRVIASGDYFEIMRDEAAFRIAERLGLTNVIDVEVECSDADEGTLRARLGDQVLRLPPWPTAAGTKLRVGLRPQDVIVAIREPSGLSVQNDLSGRIVSVSEVGGIVLVRVDIGQELIVEVTRRARQELALEGGQRVRCLFKASAVERLDL